jgi:UDP-N-acetylglucosamine 4,6-dehydratase/5-epimerase
LEAVEDSYCREESKEGKEGGRMNIDGARILVTGGTGSMGRALTSHLLANYNPEKIVIFSRNEYNQSKMASDLAAHKDKLRFILGSVTDYDRIYRAMKCIDIVVHTAALKVVPTAEYNPLEVASVNVDGTKNVIAACCERRVSKAVMLATDKAVMPVNLYGCSKAMAEKIWIESNYLEPIFSVVRYGNVMGSKGSIINRFLELSYEGIKEFEITHMGCTRYWVDFSDAISLILKAVGDKPGLILCSKTKAFKVKDLIRAIYLRAELKVTGLRIGEKVHETLINEYEAARGKDMGDHYKIFPAFSFDDEIVYDKEEGKDLTGAVTTNDADSMMVLDEVRAKVKAFEAVNG